MGGRLCNNGNNYWIIDPPSAVKSEKNRVKFGKTLCRVNSVEKICPFVALKMFLVIENHFGGAVERGDLAKVCKFWSILCKIRDGWLRAGRAL